ncbi:MAG: hypothetical protein JNL42_17205 [Anaerolineae bacterium]|nr:hypothetical protein [Anaerolineae bacterium]
MVDVKNGMLRWRDAADHGRLSALTEWVSGTAPASAAIPPPPLPVEKRRRSPVLIQVWPRA